MADFSFSFDSDNPFAEPESAPPTAPVTTDAAPATAPGANGHNGDAADVPDEAAAALDNFDFAFDSNELAPESLPTQTPAAPETVAAVATDDLDFDFPLPEQATLDTAPPEADVPAADVPAAASPEAAAEPLDFEAAPAPFAPSEEDEFADLPAMETGESESASPVFEFLTPSEPAASAAATAPLNTNLVAAGQNEIEENEGEDRPRRHEPLPHLSVAILGASGIGKNHARWFHRNGCRVTAFLGTSEESTERAREQMSADFEFEGTPYTDLAALLNAEKPDIVCVATPPALHFGHVLQALEAGAHILCEKPLVYAPTRKFRENRDGAKELVKVAAKKNLVLGTQLQYGAATPILCKLAGIAPTEVGDFAMEIETLNPHSSRDPRELWIDLGPHPVSIAQILAGPGSKLDEDSIAFDPHQSDEQSEALVRFSIDCADGRLLMVRAVVRALNPELITRKPRRRFSFNGHAVTYAPVAGRRGNFQAQFVGPDGYASVYPDPVDWLIGNFVGACRGLQPLVISGNFGRENLEWMLKIGTPAETH